MDTTKNWTDSLWVLATWLQYIYINDSNVLNQLDLCRGKFIFQRCWFQTMWTIWMQSILIQTWFPNTMTTVFIVFLIILVWFCARSIVAGWVLYYKFTALEKQSTFHSLSAVNLQMKDEFISMISPKICWQKKTQTWSDCACTMYQRMNESWKPDIYLSISSYLAVLMMLSGTVTRVF